MSHHICYSKDINIQGVSMVFLLKSQENHGPKYQFSTDQTSNLWFRLVYVYLHKYNSISFTNSFVFTISPRFSVFFLGPWLQRETFPSRPPSRRWSRSWPRSGRRGSGRRRPRGTWSSGPRSKNARISREIPWKFQDSHGIWRWFLGNSVGTPNSRSIFCRIWRWFWGDPLRFDMIFSASKIGI